jgi:hypothetical protein
MGNYEAKARRARQDLDKARDHVYGCEFDYLGFVGKFVIIIILFGCNFYFQIQKLKNLFYIFHFFLFT